MSQYSVFTPGVRVRRFIWIKIATRSPRCVDAIIASRRQHARVVMRKLGQDRWRRRRSHHLRRVDLEELVLKVII